MGTLTGDTAKCREIQGVSVTTHARQGDPADAILEVAEEQNADLVIVGNKGMTGANASCSLGAQQGLHHAPCSVLIIRTNVDAPERG